MSPIGLIFWKITPEFSQIERFRALFCPKSIDFGLFSAENESFFSKMCRNREIFVDTWSIFLSQNRSNCAKNDDKSSFSRQFELEISDLGPRNPENSPIGGIFFPDIAQVKPCGHYARTVLGRRACIAGGWISRKCPFGAGFLRQRREEKSTKEEKKGYSQSELAGCVLFARSLRSLAVNTLRTLAGCVLRSFGPFRGPHSLIVVRGYAPHSSYRSGLTPLTRYTTHNHRWVCVYVRPFEQLMHSFGLTLRFYFLLFVSLFLLLRPKFSLTCIMRA